MAGFPIGATVEVISAMRIMEVVEVGERGLRCRLFGKNEAEWYPLSDIRRDDPRPVFPRFSRFPAGGGYSAPSA